MSEITTIVHNEPLAQQVVAEMTSNPVTTFVTLLAKTTDTTLPAASSSTSSGSSTSSSGAGTGTADSSTTTSSGDGKSDKSKNRDVPIDQNVCR